MYRVLIKGLQIECQSLASLVEMAEMIEHFVGRIEVASPPTEQSPVRKLVAPKTKQRKAKAGGTREAILGALDKLGAATSSEIIEESGVEASKVYGVLNILKNTGIVRRNADGKYDRVRG